MTEQIKPSEIEKRSMEIITAELRSLGIVPDEENAAVILRAIHTSADFDYARNLRFTKAAVRLGVDALRAGAPVVTDTNMGLTGVNKTALKKLGGSAVCYMADADVAAAAKLTGVTRASISMEKAAREHPNAVFAVGNAPTALMRLSQLIEDGLRPALVIGVPVGFVNVVEAKELIWDTCEKFGIPAIVAFGRKGGSNVAAAIVNALLYSAAGMESPSARA